MKASMSLTRGMFPWLVLFPLSVATVGIQKCEPTTDVDGDEWTVEDGDCDDNDASVYPGAMETCDQQDEDCDGVVDEGYTAQCDSLACSGEGLIYTISDECLDDGGVNAGGDAVEVYCAGGIARFCLSGESCQWRESIPETDTGETCSTAGLTSDFMAYAWCEQWNGFYDYSCTTAGQIYFTPPQDSARSTH